MPPTRPDIHRLATFVRNRRKALGLTQTQVQAAGGPSTALQREIEHGHGVKSERSKARVEQVFGWEAGSVDRVLAGGDPVLVQPAENLPSSSAAAAMGDGGVNVEIVLVRMPAEASPEQRERYQRIAELVSQRVIDRLHRYGSLFPTMALAEIAQDIQRMS